MMRHAPEILEVDNTQLEAVLRRVEQAQGLDAKDAALIRAVFQSYLYVTDLVEDKNTSIRRLRQLLFGVRTEKTDAVVGQRTDRPETTMPRGDATETASAALSGDFAALYSGLGRPSIPPEMLLRAMLLQAFYSVRSERQLMERLEFDLLFRWFVGLGVDDPVWDHSTFSKNRDRLLDGEIAAKFLTAVLAQPRIKRLLSSEHFSVDGTLIEA